jgi:hypothetical protein
MGGVEIITTSVNAPAQVFCTTTENVPVDGTERAFWIDLDRGAHGDLLYSVERKMMRA